jgi:hypothetical protein
MTFRLPLLACILLCAINPAAAQKTAAAPPPSLLTYADVADLSLPAPIVAQVRIRKAEQLKGELAGNVSSTQRRYLIAADTVAVIRGLGGLPPRIAYVVDVSPDARGKWPKLVKSEVIVFARPVSDVRLKSASPPPMRNNPRTPRLQHSSAIS